MKCSVVMLLLFVSGCGRKDKANDAPAFLRDKEERSLEGTYRAVLRDSEGDKGEVLAVVKGDDIYVTVEVDDAPSGKHPQYIHLGGNCSMPGPRLIPLDSDINSQAEGQFDFPSGKDWSYYQHGSVASMTNDLVLPDDSPDDGLAKLGAGQDLVLEGSLVSIESAQVRDTICGALLRVSDELPPEESRVEPPRRREKPGPRTLEVRPEPPPPPPKQPWYRRLIIWWRNWWYNRTHKVHQ